MKKFAKILTGLVFVAGVGVARAEFEGVVDYHISMSDSKQMDTEYMIKGKKIRINMSHDGNDVSSIMDMGGKKITTLMHKQKMYMVHNIDQAMKTASKHAPEGKVSKVSGSKTILGYNCEHWIYEGKSSKVDFWGAKGLGTFMGMGGGQGAASKDDDWFKAFKDKGVFPLEVDTTMKDNKTMTMVATKVDKRSLSSGLFEVPSDYKKMDMPDMGSMMGGGSGKAPSKEDIMKMMQQYKH